MYFYKFESLDYEEQYAFELTHWRKFSKDELDKMVIDSIKKFVENDYKVEFSSPCYLDIGDLFFDNSLKNQLIKNFGFKAIDYENRVEYGGEALFGDDFRHKDRVNFKEILKDVKVPKCKVCYNEDCLIENQRF